MNKDLGKKKRGEKRKVDEENEDSSTEMEVEVSKEKERQEESEQDTSNKGKEKDIEKESNNNNNTQEKEVYKRARMVMRNGRMLYEDLVVNEGENRLIEETCYKSSHRGEIVVQAKVKEKYKSKCKTYNVIKIAKEIN